MARPLPPPPLRSALAVFVALLALLLDAPAARAQWPPDSLTNLQVLPADIGVGELTRLMAGFTRALGVRCSTCHLGEESQPLAALYPVGEQQPERVHLERRDEATEQLAPAHLDDQLVEPAVFVDVASDVPPRAQRL